MRRIGRISLTVSLGCLALAATAGADTFKPTRFTDPQAAKCTPSNCSLRGAVIAANKNAGADKIPLSEGTYELTLPETNANDSSGGDLDVKGEVRIIGRGSGLTTVDANGGSRAFSLLRDPQKTLERMNITGGQADKGAGVFVGPPATFSSPAAHKLRLLVIQANVASQQGGGIYGSLQRMVISRTTITGNSAGNGGGGLYLGAAAEGGFPTPPVVIKASTFTGNTGGLGGGLYLDGANEGEASNDPRATMRNSTFAFNVATVSGGAIASIQGALLDSPAHDRRLQQRRLRQHRGR